MCIQSQHTNSSYAKINIQHIGITFTTVRLRHSLEKIFPEEHTVKTVRNVPRGYGSQAGV